MRESLAILAELGRELTNGRDSLDWRIVEASYTNPLTVVIEGRGRSTDRRPALVAEELVRGLADLELGRDPARFSDHSLHNARSLARTLSRDGLGSFIFTTPDLPSVTPTRATVINVTKILKRRVYYEVSTLEGKLESIDINDKQVFGIFDPITNDKIVCHFERSMRGDVVNALSCRVSVEGKVKFKRSGIPVSIEVDRFEVMPGIEEMSRLGRGEPLDITDGIPSEDFVRRLRDAE